MKIDDVQKATSYYAQLKGLMSLPINDANQLLRLLGLDETTFLGAHEALKKCIEDKKAWLETEISKL